MKKSCHHRSRPHDNDDTISIEVSTKCNSNCRHCFVKGRASNESNLTFEIVKDIITESYLVSYKHLHLTGGEPLLWPDLLKTLDFAFDAGYQTILINTNGSLLTEDLCYRLSRYKGLTLSVSLEGPKPYHDRIRGKDSFESAVSGLTNAFRADLRVMVFTTVYKSLLVNLATYADDLFKSFPKIKRLVFIQLFSPDNNDYELREELLDIDDFLQMIKTTSLLHLHGFPILIKNNPFAGVIAKLTGMPWLPHTGHLHHENSLMIMANRNISLAHSTHQRFGQYAPGMIKKVLASNEYDMAIHKTGAECSECRYATFCRDNDLKRPPETSLSIGTNLPYCRRLFNRLKVITD
jgi:sulfatase maturation enzyme AslB (radical SAM superfamily)